MTKSCPGCGATAPAEARYCRHCGAALRTTTSGAGAETVSPLAATAPLTEQRSITSELNPAEPHTSTPPRALEREPDGTQPQASLSGDSGEITISVVRPVRAQPSAHDRAQLSARDVATHDAPATPSAVRATAPAASSSAARTPARGGAGAPGLTPERRALRVWLAAGIVGTLLVCVCAAGLWYLLRARHVNAPTTVVAAPADARQQAQAKVVEAQELLAAGNPVAATARLREAVALDPMSAEAHRQLAQLLLESGARQTAIEELRAVTRLEPNDRDAWRQLAEAQFAQGLYGDAADSYHTLMDVSNEALADDRLQLTYADALRLAGRTDNASALYRRLATSPLADVAHTSKQRLTEASVPATVEVLGAPTHVQGPTDANSTQPAPPAAAVPAPPRAGGNTPAASPAERYHRGVSLWPANRAAAVTEFRAAASADGNPDAYYYLGLNLAEGRDPQQLNRAELVAALEYFQRARAGRFAGAARRYEEHLGQEFDRRRKQ